MSKTILANVDGFTPLIDDIVNVHGAMTAAVFGRIWRYCQMSSGTCTAKIDKIADGLKINRMTVIRHAEILCKNGYLKDLTPDLRNKPHTYADTGKAGIQISVNAVSQEVIPAITESDSAQSLKVIPAITESDLKIPIKKVSKKAVRESSADKPRRQDLYFEHLSDICHLTPPFRDWSKLPKITQGQLNKCAGELRAIKAEPPQILEFEKWWYANDWRGKQRQLPTPTDVVKSWAIFTNGNGAKRDTTQAHINQSESVSEDLMQKGARINAQRNGTSYEYELKRLQVKFAAA